MARGGYRKPANPAPVSGPGQLSRRTDGAQPVMNMTGGAYGEAKALRNLQSGAPMMQTETNPSSAPTSNLAPTPVTPLFAPDTEPQKPITDGLAFGPGANSVPGNTVVAPSPRESMVKALQYSNDPDLETAFNYLINRGSI